MAPTQGKRPRIRAKSTKAAMPQKPQPSEDSLFPSSKRDKRSMKHSTFVSKIEKSSKSKKRRRPNKKLAANLESLADALPALDQDERTGPIEIGQAKIQRKSLKSRPGAMKRKEKLEKLERDRFNKNLVQLSGSTPNAGAGANTTSIADRWAALKNHVQSTAEKKAEFVKT